MAVENLLAEPKVPPRSQHDIAPTSPTNVFTKYQSRTPLHFPKYRTDNNLKTKGITERSNQGHNMRFHTYTPQSMSLPTINTLYLTNSEIYPRKYFKG